MSIENQNILFIDKEVIDYEIILNSINSTTFPIVYTKDTTKNEVLLLLRTKFASIYRIGFVFHENWNYIFLDNELLFLDNEVNPFSNNVQFILDMIQEFHIHNLDFLVCNTLNHKNWVEFFGVIENNSSAIVGASYNNVGNEMYGGSWFMDSIQYDIKYTYFTDSIQNYKYLFTGGNTNNNGVILSDNTIKACGDNSNGQLGNGQTMLSGVINYFSDVSTLPSGKTPKMVSYGTTYLIVLFTDGTIYGCGSNQNGQLGLGDFTTPINSLTQMPMPVGKTPIYISTSSHTIVLMSDGTIYGCGNNLSGELGTGIADARIPDLTAMVLTNIGTRKPIAITCLTSNTLILTNDGTIWGCGTNNYGQLGIGSVTTPKTSLVQMAMEAGKIPLSIAGGFSNTIVLMRDGTVWGCGYNAYAQLGIGNDNSSQPSLKQMTMPAGKIPIYISTSFHTIVLMSDGTIYGCGKNDDGELASEIFGNRLSLVPIPNNTGKIPLSIYAFRYSTSVLMSDGTVYACGLNNAGNLGIGNNTSSNKITSLTQTVINSTGTSYLTGVALLPDTINITPTNTPHYTFLYFNSSQGNVYTNNGINYIYSSAANKGLPIQYAYYTNTISINTTTLGSGIIDVYIGSTVTSIAASAFQSCTGLTSVSIPSGVTSIGASAFQGCTGLTSVSIPSSVTTIGASAFQSSGITSVIIPSGVTTINTSTFQSCTSLSSVTIPNTVTSIGASAFQGCTGLTSVSIPSSVTTIGASAFQSSGLTSVTIPTSVTTINTSTFQSCSSLTSVTIPSNVTNIGASAFQDCSALTTITLAYTGSPTITIGASAFSGLNSTLTITSSTGSAVIPASMFTTLSTSTTNVVISGTIITIGASAFQNETGITSLTIPNSITTIGISAFNSCSGLTTITLTYISSTTVTIGASAFSGLNSTLTITSSTSSAIIPASMFTTLSSSTTSVIISGTITSVGQTAFQNLASLTSVAIPTSVTTIGANAFQSCSGLSSVTIPTSVTSIGASAFQSCTGLSSLTISSTSITTINTSTFQGCTSLTSVTIPSGVITIDTNAFSGCTGLTNITIPNTIITVNSNAFASTKSKITIDGSSSGTTIPTSMFSGITSLTTLSLGNNITTIGGSAFQNCVNLSTVFMSNNLTTINDGAFNITSGTPTMTSINLVNVNSIGQNAFDGQNNLASVVSYYTNLILANGSNVFEPSGTTSATIYTNNTNATTNTYLPYYFKNIVTSAAANVTIYSSPFTLNNNPSNALISLGGNTNNNSISKTNQLYGIPQTLNSDTNTYWNYITNLQPNLQITLYNLSGITQYIQFLPYCNGISSNSTGASVINVFTIANNICAIQNKSAITFVYIGTISDSTTQGYIVQSTNKL